MNINTLSVSCKGSFKITLKDNRGNIKQELPFQENLITDSGLNLLRGHELVTVRTNTRIPTKDIMYSCVLGESNVAPKVTDTSLNRYLGMASLGENYSETVIDTYVSNPNTVTRLATKKFSFSNRDRNVQVKELGLAYVQDINSGDYLLYSHALIKNHLGNPTAISFEVGDTLEIEYQFATYYDVRPQHGEFMLTHVQNAGVGAKYIEYMSYMVGFSATGSNKGIDGIRKSGSPGITGYAVDVSKTPNLDAPYFLSNFPKLNNHTSATQELIDLINNNTTGVTTGVITGRNVIANVTDASNDYVILQEEGRSATGNRIVKYALTYSALNFPNGIRCLAIPLAAFDSNGEAFTLYLFFWEKGKSRGITKTANDMLSFTLEFKVGRFEGNS